MNFLTFPLGAQEIEVTVPCRVRATCYENLITDQLTKLYIKFKQNPFLNKAILQPSLIEGLVKVLDGEVCRYVDYDLKSYAERESLKNLPGKEGLAKYYEDRGQDKLYGDYLNATFPALANLLGLLCEQFQAAMANALHNIDDDKENLINLFMPETQTVLARVIPTFSDLHKKGQQVLILEFAAQNQAVDSQVCIRLIYKPSSILVDMMFLGNIAKLRERGIKDLPGLDTAKSITEIVNAVIHNVYGPLPTYLIYPRECANVVDSYGYIEYLPHQPWPENLENKIFEAIETEQDAAEQQKRKPRYVSIPDTVIEREFDAVLIEAQRKMLHENLPCDYIGRDQNDHARYSYQCGVLASMATAFGITDMHIQNLIISRIQPYLIDLEVSLNPVEANIEATGFLDPGTGSMIKTVTEATSLLFLNSIEGIDFVGFSLPQKNRFYMLNTGGDEPVLVNPLAEFFNQGFAEFMQLLATQQEAFTQWLVHPLVRSMSVRILPYATSDFIKWLDEYKFQDFQFFSLKKMSLAQVEEEKKSFLINKIAKAEIERSVRENVMESPIFSIFTSTNIKNNYDSLNIPVFYMKVSENQLIDSAGNVVEINYERVAEICELEAEARQSLLSAARESYFENSPLEFITEQISKIMNDGSYRQVLISNALNQTQKKLSKALPEIIPSSSPPEASIEPADEHSSRLFQQVLSEQRHHRDCTAGCNIL